MVSIDFDKKYLFLHLPKNGGTSIQMILFKNYDFIPYNYLTFEYKKCPYSYSSSLSEYFSNSKLLESIEINNLDEYTKFTFVRNPYTRFISGWKFIIQSKLMNEYTIKETIQNKDLISSVSYNHIFALQTYHMKNWSFEVVGKFESLSDDLCFILKSYGYTIDHELLHLNKTECKNPLITYYDEEILAFVNSHFYDDFIAFDYEIANNMEELNKILFEL